MIMKKSFPLLRAIGLSAGLIASTAMMAPAQADTSGTITATGTVPATCSVNGADIAMTYNDDYKNLYGVSTFIPASTNGTSTTFIVTKPMATFPTGTSSDVYGRITTDFRTGTLTTPGNTIASMSGNIRTDSKSSQMSSTITGAFNGVVRFIGDVGDTNYVALLPGTYTLSSTFTCITN
jgi:hypothetical protein